MFKLDISQEGIRAVLKPYQEQVFNVLEKHYIGYMGSREVWEEVNARLSKDVSRASIINYLKALDRFGVLEADETTGKGGKRDEYRLIIGGLPRVHTMIASALIASIISAFPDADMTQIVNELLDMEVVEQ